VIVWVDMNRVKPEELERLKAGAISALPMVDRSGRVIADRVACCSRSSPNQRTAEPHTSTYAGTGI